ncbi:unnamed protein product [Closterium sp. NIES-54]
MLAVAPPSRRRDLACGSLYGPPAVQIDGLDYPSEGLASTVVMARFSSDPGAQKFLTLVDASKATAAGAQSVTGAGTFLRPTPPRSSREGSAAPAGGFRHRHWHSFSDFQDSLDGAYDGDIGDSPCAPHPSTVAAASADAAATSGDVSSLRLNAPPAAAARNSVPPAAASASAVATSPTEAMRPGRSRSHGSDTMARRRLTRHRRTQSVEAVMEYYGVTEQALTLTPMGQVQATTCFLKLPCSGPSPASSVSSSPSKPLSVEQSPCDAAACSLKAPCSRPSPPSSASSFPSKPLSGKQSFHDAATCSLKSPCSRFSPPSPTSSAFSSPSEPLSPPHLSPPPLSSPSLSPPPLSPPLSPPPLSPLPLSSPPLTLLSSSKPISLPTQSKLPFRPPRSKPRTGLSASARFYPTDSYGQVKRNADAEPPSPRHRMTKCVRHSYTAKEKLHWLKMQEFQPDLSNRALAKLAKVQPCQIRDWKKMRERLEVASGCRRRLMGAGRKAKYPFMERAVYCQFLSHRAKGLSVSVNMLQKWSAEYMKHRMPGSTPLQARA